MLPTVVFPHKSPRGTKSSQEIWRRRTIRHTCMYKESSSISWEQIWPRLANQRLPLTNKIPANLLKHTFTHTCNSSARARNLVPFPEKECVTSLRGWEFCKHGNWTNLFPVFNELNHFNYDHVVQILVSNLVLDVKCWMIANRTHHWQLSEVMLVRISIICYSRCEH